MSRKYHQIRNFHIEYGHTLDEYRERFGSLYDESDLWDYSLEDINNNAIEGCFDVLYWGILVEGKIRVFETTIKEEFEIDYILTQDYLLCIYQNDRNNTIFEVYNKWKNTDFENTKKNLISVILQDYDFLSYVYKEEGQYMDEHLSKRKFYNERHISLDDECGKLVVKTNAPFYVIENAISYRDTMFENNIPINDFDCIQEYIKNKGYTFEEVYVKESYNW